MKNTKTEITMDEVKHLAKLANLTLTAKQLENIPKQLSSVIDYMSKIKSLKTENVPETSQVTNLENVFREDVVDNDRMFTQQQALSNAKNKHNGYFKVKAIFEE
jgi:aspartyl-tRNA(Asn)/glutamyl-tRNA(Gln) amidotransferase subunit C